MSKEKIYYFIELLNDYLNEYYDYSELSDNSIIDFLNHIYSTFSNK